MNGESTSDRGFPIGVSLPVKLAALSHEQTWILFVCLDGSAAGLEERYKNLQRPPQNPATEDTDLSIGPSRRHETII
jgi:hypothetical protein